MLKISKMFVGCMFVVLAITGMLVIAGCNTDGSDGTNGTDGTNANPLNTGGGSCSGQLVGNTPAITPSDGDTGALLLEDGTIVRFGNYTTITKAGMGCGKSTCTPCTKNGKCTKTTPCTNSTPPVVSTNSTPTPTNNVASVANSSVANGTCPNATNTCPNVKSTCPNTKDNCTTYRSAKLSDLVCNPSDGDWADVSYVSTDGAKTCKATLIKCLSSKCWKGK